MERRIHRPHVHSSRPRRPHERRLRPLRQQTLPVRLGPVQRQTACREALDPHDVLVLVHPRRSVYLRMDIVPAHPLDRTRDRWLARRVRVHFLVQFGKQLLRLVPSPVFLFNHKPS